VDARSRWHRLRPAHVDRRSLIAPAHAADARQAGPSGWTVELAEEALSEMGDAERALLWRVAEARGRRVAMSELASAFGLPKAPAVDKDFPALSSYCASRTEAGHPEPAMPVQEGDKGTDGWYWMSVSDSGDFRRALDKTAHMANS
jgi:hypothetical protein